MGHANSRQLLSLAENAKEKEACELLDSCYAVDCNFTNSLGETPLHLACANNLITLVRKLLQHGADTSRLNKFSSTALMIASRMGYVEIVRLLLKSGADPNVVGESQLNALSVACGWKRVSVVRLLLESHSLIQELSLLLACVHADGHEMCRLLLNHGAAVNSTDCYNNTALMQAAVRGHWQLVNVLVSREWTPRINVNAHNIYGWTALHFAYAGLSKSLAIHASVDDSFEVQPLHSTANDSGTAVGNGSSGVEVGRGRDSRQQRRRVAPIIEDRSESSSVENGSEELSAARKKQEMNSNRVIELLLRKGAKTEVQNDEGCVPSEVTEFLERQCAAESEDAMAAGSRLPHKRRRTQLTAHSSDLGEMADIQFGFGSEKTESGTEKMGGRRQPKRSRTRTRRSLLQQLSDESETEGTASETTQSTVSTAASRKQRSDAAHNSAVHNTRSARKRRRRDI